MPLHLLPLAADYVFSRVWLQSVVDTVSLSYLPPSALCPRNDRKKKSSLAFWKKEITRLGRTCCWASYWARNTIVITIPIYKCLQLGAELSCANEVTLVTLWDTPFSFSLCLHFLPLLRKTNPAIGLYFATKLIHNIADVKDFFLLLSLGTGRKALLLPDGDLPASLYLIGCLGCKSRILARLAGPAQTAVSGSACLPR